MRSMTSGLFTSHMVRVPMHICWYSETRKEANRPGMLGTKVCTIRSIRAAVSQRPSLRVVCPTAIASIFSSSISEAILERLWAFDHISMYRCHGRTSSGPDMGSVLKVCNTGWSGISISIRSVTLFCLADSAKVFLCQ
jgi:hypothetical protein